MIPLAEPNLTGREAEYLLECVSSNFVSTVGPFVKAFEELACSVSGYAHGIATNTGTSALHVVLTALGVRRHDLVILPTYTFIASANAVRACGADPWLFDIETDTWGLDVGLLRAELQGKAAREGGVWVHRHSNRRISALLAVCPAGNAPNLAELYELCQDMELPLVVDAAGAAGLQYRGAKLGESAEHAVLSFNGNKTFTAGGGGMVLTRDEKLADRVRHLSTTARVSRDYLHDAVGFNYRMTNLQAAVGCAQLERADDFLAIKHTVDRRYRSGWQGGCLHPFPRGDALSSTYWMTGAVLPRGHHMSVPDVVHYLAEHGIEARGFWRPIHLQPPYVGAPRTRMPVSDKLWPQVLVLPSSTSLTSDDQNYVVRLTRQATDL